MQDNTAKITHISKTSEISEIKNSNTLFITVTEFKTSDIQILQNLKETKISEFPSFTAEKNNLYINIEKESEKFDAFDARAKGETLHKIAQKYCNTNIQNYVFTADKNISDHIFSALIDGIHLGTYTFNQYKSKTADSENNKNIYIVTKNAESPESKKIQKEREAWTTGVQFTKDMINTPPSIALPSYIETKTRELFSDIKNVKITSLLENELRDLNAGGILSVGQASPDQSRFLIVEYTNADTTQKPIGLVGKGVTYDTGGLSLKPSNAMTGMKKDMGGAATILGGLYAAAKSEVSENIVAVIPLAENLISEKAYKPDDIVTMMNGKTVEITNTDAEGRLLLGDALVYIEKVFSPRILIDMATLTGACAYAIGEDISAVFTTTDALFNKISTSAENTDEPIWRLPLYKRYEKKIESNIADIVNAATGFKAGTIQAALFLKNFVDPKTPWAHFDIAYSSFDSKTNFATGKDVRLLLDFIKNESK